VLGEDIYLFILFVYFWRIRQTFDMCFVSLIKKLSVAQDILYRILSFKIGWLGSQNNCLVRPAQSSRYSHYWVDINIDGRHEVSFIFCLLLLITIYLLKEGKIGGMTSASTCHALCKSDFTCDTYGRVRCLFFVCHARVMTNEAYLTRNVLFKIHVVFFVLLILKNSIRWTFAWYVTSCQRMCFLPIL